MSAIARALAALVVVAVLADASACLTAPTVGPAGDGVVRVSAVCACGCHAHTGSLGGIGLTQLAAPPAETPVPSAAPAWPARAAVSQPSAAPARRIDHVPISLA